ncbi:uncharacterized protein BKA55DRAFT_680053 [Fusarium redolens]|uniref:Uncharacterized protein n=1 Tax=Fusarium redolens TaxID=48865 RepID=A0A9P9G4L1_FUSRE|nr:uncharacterized protein BKA55DRAFT_680053 [Fusarium redolens]KAH7232381.1 hypothetical protein BKA55DRAFT_680053 [Fusarium redolens]
MAARRGRFGMIEYPFRHARLTYGLGSGDLERVADFACISVTSGGAQDRGSSTTSSHGSKMKSDKDKGGDATDKEVEADGERSAGGDQTFNSFSRRRIALNAHIKTPCKFIRQRPRARQAEFLTAGTDGLLLGALLPPQATAEAAHLGSRAPGASGLGEGQGGIAQDWWFTDPSV